MVSIIDLSMLFIAILSIFTQLQLNDQFGDVRRTRCCELFNQMAKQVQRRYGMGNKLYQ
jgi:hypothetical protein